MRANIEAARDAALRCGDTVKAERLDKLLGTAAAAVPAPPAPTETPTPRKRAPKRQTAVTAAPERAVTE